MLLVIIRNKKWHALKQGKARFCKKNESVDQVAVGVPGCVQVKPDISIMPHFG